MIAIILDKAVIRIVNAKNAKMCKVVNLLKIWNKFKRIGPNKFNNLGIKSMKF